MARPIRETPILLGKDARLFEKKMREVKPLSEERCKEMRKQYESFLNKVTIKVWTQNGTDSVDFRLWFKAIRLRWKDYKGKGLGSEFMTTIKYILDREENHSTFRFLTVDAYLSAIPFYERNDFQMLLSEDIDRHTRMMYFDMMRL